ncbi:MAG TPA: hypothetical protein VFL90_12445 [Methylomirabilota bacterium]|nr:hypothetical protein [Methylomirabilota bacterium]
MTRRLLAGMLIVAALLLAGAPAQAWHSHGHVFIGVGPYPYWWYPPPYYYYPPPYAYEPPPVIVEEPPVYVERPQTPAAPAMPPGYWYYCESAKGYYPSVPSCPEGWVKVPPRQ